MPLGIHRVTTARAHRPAGRHDLAGAFCEGTGRSNRYAYDQHFFLFSALVLAQWVELHDNLGCGGVPAQSNGTEAELHLDVF